VARIESIEMVNISQWSAIEVLRADVKSLLMKIGMLVGGISILNTVVIGVVVYYVTKA
jgi:hypothetical protein